MKKYIGLEEMSNGNCASVLAVINQHGAISRREITQITGLSWGGMTKIVNKLFENEYLVESQGEKISPQGKAPMLVGINRDQNFVMGLDVNRMGLSGCVMNLAGEVIRDFTRECSFDEKENLLSGILSFIQDILSGFPGKRFLAIGIAMQGLVDSEKGISIHFPKCKAWNQVPLGEICKEKFQMEVYVEHDPDCMLYSVKKQEENVLLFRVDSSVGMAVSVNGNVLRGKGLLEIAHQIVIPNGKECRCGQRGCLEAYTAPTLVNKEFRGNYIGDLIGPLSIALGNMCNLFQSHKVIVTGSLVKYKEYFQRELMDQFFQYCNSDEVSIEFMDETGHAVHGAALIAMESAIEKMKL